MIDLVKDGFTNSPDPKIDGRCVFSHIPSLITEVDDGYCGKLARQSRSPKKVVVSITGPPSVRVIEKTRF